MTYKKMIVIDIYDLEFALIQQYVSKDFSNLREVLFENDYMNDCYKSYCFDGTYDETDDENAHILNCVNTFLQDIFPDEDTVLIDISW